MRMPRTAVTAPSAIRIPEGVREVIGRRLNLLSPACNEVLSAGLGDRPGLRPRRAGARRRGTVAMTQCWKRSMRHLAARDRGRNGTGSIPVRTCLDPDDALRRTADRRAPAPAPPRRSGDRGDAPSRSRDRFCPSWRATSTLPGLARIPTGDRLRDPRRAASRYAAGVRGRDRLLPDRARPAGTRKHR